MMRYVPKDRPSVFDAPDVMTGVTQMMGTLDSRREMRPLWRWETVKTRRFEASAARTATVVTVPSDGDAEAFQRMGARRVIVVPNGVDLEATAHRLPSAGATIILVAYFAWRPNAEAALELCERIFPRVRERIESATLTLVGAGLPSQLMSSAGSAVACTGGVEDVLPYLRRARVTVMPLRAGGGTRIKVLEALAAGVPVVATPFAVKGIEVRHGEHVLIAQSPADLAELAVRVIEDDQLAAGLSQAGRRLVERRYGWRTAARPLLDLHRELTEVYSKR
jgi:glycosyltransferase involved in cell wall biosynthesis